MFSTYILRRLRPCIVFQSFSNIHVTSMRHGTRCFGGISGNQLHAVRRSFFDLNNKVQSHCPSTRCLSTGIRSEDGNLIYTGNLSYAVRGVKMFSYSTSGVTIALLPHILLKTGLGFHSVAMQAAFCGVIGFFTFLTPVLLHLITRGYVMRLYHDPDRDTYTAVTCGIFLTDKKRLFHQRQVRIPPVSKMFTTFYADSVGLLVNPDLFHLPHDYNHLMGYDKPFRFDADTVSGPDKS